MQLCVSRMHTRAHIGHSHESVCSCEGYAIGEAQVRVSKRWLNLDKPDESEEPIDLISITTDIDFTDTNKFEVWISREILKHKAKETKSHDLTLVSDFGLRIARTIR